MDFRPDSNLVQEHRSWLDAFATQHVRNWEKLLEAGSEAAMCEAAVRRLLQENGNKVIPNEDLSGSIQTPDFRCVQKGKEFFVEVTCISIEIAVEKTLLPSSPHGATRDYHLNLNRAIFRAVTAKTRQCSRLNAPAIVVVGTFHSKASRICFGKEHLQMLLTGQELITQDINTATGEPVNDLYLSTQLCWATFLRPDESGGMGYARNPVSALVICGFGCKLPEIRGLLHPTPVHVFDPALLSAVEFCRLRAGYESGQLSTEWVNEVETEKGH